LNRKRKIFILGILVLLLIAGGFFWWWKYYETPPEKWDEAKYSKPEDYEIIETPEGTFVENKKAGLSFKVPEGWRVEKEKYSDYVALLSPDAKEISFIIEDGCKIKAEVRYIKTTLQTIEQVLQKRHKNWGYMDTYEIIEVDKHKGLKNITGIETLKQHYIGVHIPVVGFFESKTYSLGVNSNFEDREICAQAFEQFLKTVSIK